MSLADAQAQRDARGDLAAYVLLITSLVILGFASEEWVLVAPFLIGVGLHPLLEDRFTVRLGYLGYLALAVPFAILSNVYEVEGRMGIGGLNTPFYVALYMQLYAILRLYRPQPDKDRLPVVLVCSGMGIASAGSDAPSGGLFLGLISAYAIALVFVLRAHMQSRSRGPGARRLVRVAVTGAVVATFYVTLAGVGLVRSYYHDLNNAMMRLAMRMPLASAAGFGDHARIGDISRLRFDLVGRRIAVRGFSSTAPGYLRGKAFLRYGAARWSTGRGGKEINLRAAAAAAGGEGEGKGAAPDPDRRILRYPLPGRPAPEAYEEASLWLHPASDYKAHFFLPLDATAVDTTTETIFRLTGNTLKSKFKSTSRGYGVFTQGSAVFDPPVDENADLPVANRETVSPVYRELPPSERMAAALDAVLAKIRAQFPFDPAADGPKAAVRAIRDYFQTHYTYRIGIEFETDTPLVEWLDHTRHQHGHCELFASAGTLLLRRLGIPARYVTGFVCREKNPYMEMWVARNRHAHAWVEVFDAEKGWTTAEFTPGNGQPQFGPASGFAAFLEYLRGLWERTAGFVLREGASGLFGLLGRVGYWLIATWPRRIVVTLAIACFFLYRLWKRRSRRSKMEWAARELPAGLQADRKAYLALEKQLARHGLGRSPAETLAAYAARLAGADFPDRSQLPDRASVVAFVRAYADKRYAPFAAQDAVEAPA